MIQLRRYTPEFYDLLDHIGLMTYADAHEYAERGIEIVSYYDKFPYVINIPDELYIQVILGFRN